MLGHSNGNSYSGLISYSRGDRFSGSDLHGRFKYAHRNRGNQLPMEYGSDNSKHYGQSDINNHVFCYRNKCKRVFWYCLRDRDRWVVSKRHSHCIGAITMPWNFKYSYCDWRNQLSMEHGRDNAKYYCQSKLNHYLFCHRNEFQRMLGYGNGYGYGKFNP